MVGHGLALRRVNTLSHSTFTCSICSDIIPAICDRVIAWGPFNVIIPYGAPLTGAIMYPTFYGASIDDGINMPPYAPIKYAHDSFIV